MIAANTRCMPDSSTNGDADFLIRATHSLDRFLEEGGGLFPKSIADPEVSVVIVARNPAPYLFRCLEALGRADAVSLEVVVVVKEVANDLVDRLLDRIENLRVVRVPKIASYSHGWNQGAKTAKGTNLIFLKDDVCVNEKAIGATLKLLRSEKDVGAVGAMLLNRNGVLIEAGSRLESSGICQSVGRGWNPDDYRVQYRRDVLFCSGAYLGITRAIFASVEGFDESYLDEYYEDVDLCLKLKRDGKRVVYDPCSIAIRNLEYRDSWGKALVLLTENRKRLVLNRGPDLVQLSSNCEFNSEAVFECARGQRILWIEDAPPFAHMGAGFPRTKEMLMGLIELGHSVTLLPTFITASDFADVYRDTPREVEVALGVGIDGFEEFWKRRSVHYDTVIVSRPNNLKAVCHYLENTKKVRPELRLLYDAEAVFANREISERRYYGDPLTKAEEKRLLEKELLPAKPMDAVFAISKHEEKQFRSLGFTNVFMLRHHSHIQPTKRTYGERKDILFVGAVHSDSAPNALGLIDFIENALPLIRSKLGADIKLYCAGKYHSEILLEYASDTEVFLGFVEDLSGWYERCRLFIAPAKFAAGIPLKIIEASSKGIPVVGTELARIQLGWSDEEMLSADSAASFADACVQVYSDESLWSRLREGALAKVREEYSREHIITALRSALE